MVEEVPEVVGDGGGGRVTKVEAVGGDGRG